MRIINLQQSEICSAITITFFVFVIMALLIVFIFSNSRKKINSNDYVIKRIEHEEFFA